LRTAIELGNKAIALDDYNPSVHAHMVYLYIMTRNFDKAFEEAEKAVSISPNYAGGYFALGFAFVNTGQFQKAISALEKCLRLSPTPISSNVLVLLGNSYLNLGKYEEAIVTFKKALNIFGQDQLFVHIGLAQTYVLMDLEKEAQTEAAEIMRIDPDFSIVQFLKPWPMSREKKDQIAAILRKTGLPEHPTLPLPDKPSIAVLAFDNLSGDPEQEYLSDGFTEDIINSLAKIPKMFVIARNSSFTFKGKPVKVQQVSKELGVRYILEGSVRKSENQLRITAQLIDAIAGNHLWAERYDRKIEELFNIQDEITKSIITALQVILTEGEQIVVYGKGTRNLDAYIKYLQTREQFLKFDKDGVIRARKMAKETIALDSKYANGYALLAWTNLFDVWFGMTKSPKESFQQAIQLANKAIDLDNSLHNPYRLLSHTYTLMRQYDKAVNAGERALELGPNSADAHATMGQTLNYAGRPDEAINLLEKAIRLNPYPPSWYLHNLGGAYISAGRYGEAVEVLKKAVDRQPKDQFAHLGLTIAYILVGRKDQAVIEAKEVMKINPNFKLIHFEKTAPYKNKDSLKLRTDALREAGF
jgi:TolB-like protein/Tfp pilus assembly protein PilF